MTGRELIIYILQNGLEDAEINLGNNVFVKSNTPTIPPFIDETEAAIKFGVGVDTIRAWYFLGKLSGKYKDNKLYILRTAERPKEV